MVCEATRPSRGADEFEAGVGGREDLDRLPGVVEQIDDVEAAARAANVLNRWVGLLLVERGPLPVLVIRWRAAREQDPPGGVLPIAFDRLAGGGLRVGGETECRSKQDACKLDHAVPSCQCGEQLKISYVPQVPAPGDQVRQYAPGETS